MSWQIQGSVMIGPHDILLSYTQTITFSLIAKHVSKTQENDLVQTKEHSNCHPLRIWSNHCIVLFLCCHNVLQKGSPSILTRHDITSQAVLRLPLKPLVIYHYTLQVLCQVFHLKYIVFMIVEPHHVIKQCSGTAFQTASWVGLQRSAWKWILSLMVMLLSVTFMGYSVMYIWCSWRNNPNKGL